MDLILTCKYSLIKYSLNKQCVYGRVVEGSRLLICRGEIPIVGSIPTGHANKYN